MLKLKRNQRHVLNIPAFHRQEAASKAVVWQDTFHSTNKSDMLIKIMKGLSVYCYYYFVTSFLTESAANYTNLQLYANNQSQIYLHREAVITGTLQN